MGFAIWSLVAIYLLAVALFIRVNAMGKVFGKLVTKTLASVLFFVIGILCTVATPLGSGRVYYPVLMLIGLFLGLVGDVALEYQNVFPRKREKYFLAGLTAFMFGHAFYIILFMCVAKITFLQFFAGLVAFLVLVVLMHVLKLSFGDMHMPVMIYAAVIALMVGFAFGALVYAPGLQTTMIFIGAVSFAVSDVVLAYLYFGPRRIQKKLPVINLSTYYLAQILFALSIWLR